MGTLVPLEEPLSVQEAVSKVLGDGNWIIAKAEKKKSGLSNGDKALVASNVASAGLGVGAMASIAGAARANAGRDFSPQPQQRGGLPRAGMNAMARRSAPLRRSGNGALRAIGRTAAKPALAGRKFGHNRVGAAIVGAGLVGGSAFNAAADAASAYSIAQKGKVKKRDEFTIEATVSKSIDDKRQVFGWASITEMNGEPVVDLQGDYVTIEVIEKAAHAYLTSSRKGGDMHRRNGDEPHHVADLIESVVITPEKKKALGLPDDSPTGWWVGYQVNDDATWDLVKNGKRPMFSIHGSGQRVEKDL